MQNKLELPTCDDKPLWDIWLSTYYFPCLVVADHFGLFSFLANSPETLGKIVEKFSFVERAAEGLIGVLTSLGFLVQYEGRFHLTEVSRNFLLPESPYYWGGLLQISSSFTLAQALIQALKDDTFFQQAKLWEKQKLDAEKARSFTQVMHAHGLPAALGLAKRINLNGKRKLLDIGGGSGCYSIAFAMNYPKMKFTIIDFPTVCDVANEYIKEYNLQEVIDTHPIDMFDEDWPPDQDAVFFSDIFHNWKREKCQRLIQQSFNSLCSDGHIYIHEILLSDTKDSPIIASAYTMKMLLFTEGKQLSSKELTAMLQEGGFRQISIRPSYGYYSLISGVKA